MQILRDSLNREESEVLHDAQEETLTFCPAGKYYIGHNDPLREIPHPYWLNNCICPADSQSNSSSQRRRSVAKMLLTARLPVKFDLVGFDMRFSILPTVDYTQGFREWQDAHIEIIFPRPVHKWSCLFDIVGVSIHSNRRKALSEEDRSRRERSMTPVSGLCHPLSNRAKSRLRIQAER